MIRKLLILVFIVIYNPCFSQLKGKVVAVQDGDTFTLLTSDKKQIKIRLFGIDCPENGQDYGNKAKQFLSNLIFGKEVYVEDKGKEKYGRTLGIVFIDSINANEALLSNGYAWHYQKYYKSEKYANLQKIAKDKRLGLWKGSNPIPPWEQRKGSNQKPKNGNVFICETGKAYHAAYCTGLSRCKSKVSEISTKKAKEKKYKPCSICNK